MYNKTIYKVRMHYILYLMQPKLFIAFCLTVTTHGCGKQSFGDGAIIAATISICIIKMKYNNYYDIGRMYNAKKNYNLPNIFSLCSLQIKSFAMSIKSFCY